MKGYKQFNENTKVAGNTRGGGSSSGRTTLPNGSATMKTKTPDKYVAFPGKGGAANGRNVGKGC